MLYAVDVTVPAVTAERDAVETLLPVAPGVLVGASVMFPAGCAGLVHVRILRSRHQVWPSNLDGSLVGDGVEISWQEEYMLFEEPYQFRLMCWNEDDTFGHTVTVRLNVVAGLLIQAVPSWLQRLLGIRGRA